MNEYQKSFIDPLEQPQTGLEKAVATLDAAHKTSKHWPEVHARLDSVVVATLKRWLQTITSLLQPIDFWPLRRERLHLSLWSGAKWLHPRIVQTRLQNVGLFLRFLLGWIWLNRYVILKVLAFVAIVITFVSAVIWLLWNWHDLLSSMKILISNAFG